MSNIKGNPFLSSHAIVKKGHPSICKKMPIPCDKSLYHEMEYRRLFFGALYISRETFHIYINVGDHVFLVVT